MSEKGGQIQGKPDFVGVIKELELTEFDVIVCFKKLNCILTNLFYAFCIPSFCIFSFVFVIYLLNMILTLKSLGKVIQTNGLNYLKVSMA